MCPRLHWLRYQSIYAFWVKQLDQLGRGFSSHRQSPRPITVNIHQGHLAFGHTLVSHNVAQVKEYRILHPINCLGHRWWQLDFIQLIPVLIQARQFTQIFTAREHVHSIGCCSERIVIIPFGFYKVVPVWIVGIGRDSKYKITDFLHLHKEIIIWFCVFKEQCFAHQGIPGLSINWIIQEHNIWAILVNDATDALWVKLLYLWNIQRCFWQERQWLFVINLEVQRAFLSDPFAHFFLIFSICETQLGWI